MRQARAEMQSSCSFAPPSVLPDISPSRGEIGCHIDFRQSPILQDERLYWGRPISPLEGEMSGRTEGGNAERRAFPIDEALSKATP